MSCREALDQGANFADLVRIEPDGRLVKDQDVGLVDQGIGETDPLAVALGECADELSLHVPETAEFQGVIDLLPDTP